MARPKTKAELVDLSKKNFNRLVDFVAAMKSEDRNREFPPGTLNRNVRDVLAHLHHWHTMFFDWYMVGMAGEKPDIPAKGYTWKTTPELNRLIQEKYANTPLKGCQQLLEESNQKVNQIIMKHSNDDLFTKKKYKWTGATSLGAYLISATSSHYDWALKLIKKANKG